MTNSNKLPTPPKHIGRRAGKIFTYHLPDHWIIRSQEDQEDYGVDYEIQLGLENADAVTEDIFKIQLKGINKTKDNLFADINGKKALKYTLKIDKIKHYANLEIPIFLVIVLIETKEIFWVHLQDNKEIKKILEEKANQKTATIHLDKEFKIKKNMINNTDELIDQYRDICVYLWNTKERKLGDYSDHSINSVIELRGKQLFSFVMERYSRDLESDPKKINEHNINEKVKNLLYLTRYLNLNSDQEAYLKAVVGKDDDFYDKFFNEGAFTDIEDYHDEQRLEMINEKFDETDNETDDLQSEYREEVIEKIINDREYWEKLVDEIKTDVKIYDEFLKTFKNRLDLVEIVATSIIKEILDTDSDLQPKFKSISEEFKQELDELKEKYKEELKKIVGNLI